MTKEEKGLVERGAAEGLRRIRARIRATIGAATGVYGVGTVARLCGVSVATVYRWRRGDSDPALPQQVMLWTLATMAATGQRLSECEE